MDKENSVQYPFNVSSSIVVGTGLSPPKCWQTIKYNDIPEIQKAIAKKKIDVFGDKIDIEEIIEFSIINIILKNKIEDIIGFICLRNHPNIPALDTNDWSYWIKYHYNLDYTAEDTLFVHYLFWNDKYKFDYFSSGLKMIYLDNCKINHIIIVSPPTSVDSAKQIGQLVMHSQFDIVLPHACTDNIGTQYLFVNSRKSTVPRLKIRRALAKDNDDLVEILDRSCPNLRTTYGNYYIAEIILNQPSTRSIIVAEHESFAVGMLCLNTRVALDILHENFQVEPFHGFRKHIDGDEKLFATKKSLTSSLRWQDERSCSNSLISDTSSISSLTLYSLKSSSTSSENSSIGPNTQFINDMITSTTDNSLEDAEKHETNRVVHNFTMNSDAFCIEMYGLHWNFDERVSFDLLQAIFEAHPKLHYCLMSFPTTMKTLPIQEKFMKVMPKRNSTFDHCLYALHKQSYAGKLSINEATTGEMGNIRKFIGNLHNKYYIGDLIQESINTFYEKEMVKHENSTHPFVIYCDDNIIGFFILRVNTELNSMRYHYEIESYMNVEQHERLNRSAILKLFVIHPIFRHRLPFVFGEIFRQVGYGSFFYKLQSMNQLEHNPITILSDMIPIHPRKSLKYCRRHLAEGKIPQDFNLIDCKPNFALYHQNIRLCNKPKTNINLRIVIVGCSSTSLSFIETLIFNNEAQHLWFSELVLISHNGFPHIYTKDPKHLEKLFVSNGVYTKKYLRKISLQSWLTVVTGNVTKIDRKNKFVIINGETEMKYDYLYLLFGRQFGFPHNLKQFRQISILSAKPSTLPQSAVTNQTPGNFFFLNNFKQAKLMMVELLRFLKLGEDCCLHTINTMELSLYDKYNIIVYGNCLECFICINFLIENNVNPPMITFIRPGMEESSTIFNDDFTMEKMQEFLNELSIRQFNDYELIDWHLDDNRIDRITIKPCSSMEKNNETIVSCSLFISYEKRLVSPENIAVIVNSGLVFDGRLIIDDKCLTNDPFIYAAGPLTKYRKILYADPYRHGYFNTVEIGRKLAEDFLRTNNLLARDDISDGGEVKSLAHSEKNIPLTVTIYKEPTIKHCRILNNYNYLCVKVPLSWNTFTNPEVNPGFDIITGKTITKPEIITENNVNEQNPENDLNYFRLHFNQYNKIDKIVCLTKKKINVQQLSNLWGKHEKLLNNILEKFQQNLIDDLFDYFEQSTFYAIHYDRFDQLLQRNKVDILAMNKCVTVDRNAEISSSQLESIRALCKSKKFEQIIQDNTQCFVAKHSKDLPMYLNSEKNKN